MVLIGLWVHLFPSRTQKLSINPPTILAGRLAGKIGNANIIQKAPLRMNPQGGFAVSEEIIEKREEIR